MKMIKLNKWQTILAIIVSCITIIGAGFAFCNRVDNRYCKAIEVDDVKVELQLVSDRLDQKILNDRINQIQERIWLLQDRYECTEAPVCETKMDKEEREVYRYLLKELKDTEIKFKKISSS